MGAFTKISSTAFDELQLDAGMILNSFDPENAVTPPDDAIICATTGGITIECASAYSDMGADVDNCPNNTKELMRLDGRDCKIRFTALTATADVFKLALGAADINDGVITPRSVLKPSDFEDIWWVGDRSDGGLAAVCLKNAISTSGLSIKTTKKGTGQFAVELTGHISIDDPETVPMEFYVKEAA